MWQRYNQCLEVGGALNQGFPFSLKETYDGVCVCLLLQDLLPSCSRGGRRRVEDMCYERRRAEACVDVCVYYCRTYYKAVSVG